jgi:signal transduction histidine kinase
MSGESTQKARVLYVDDLQTNLLLFQATFERDYEVLIAESAEKALEIMKELEIPVLVTDQRMPDMTGTELLEKVALEYPDTRRFLLTAFTDFDTVVEAVNKGQIHGYINKPFKADDVRISINHSLETYFLIRENRRIRSELEAANKDLIGLDGIKTDIIKLISQEIRNPLNRIMGTLHLLKNMIEGQELTDLVNVLDESVTRLEEFASMTEQLSLLKSPGHDLKVSAVPLKRIIEYGIIEAADEMKEKGVDVDLQIESEDTLIQGESRLLVNGLLNLIRNAIAHTPAGTSLTIRTRESGEGIVCEVIDQGKNYTPELLAQLENNLTMEKKGLDLGLGIELGLAQMVMETHNGKIIFARTRDKKGSVSMIFARPV